jgi:hypothetical protein
MNGQYITWTADIPIGQTFTATVMATPLFNSEVRFIPVTAVIEDGQTDPLVRSNALTVSPYQLIFPYFPFMAKAKYR